MAEDVFLKLKKIEGGCTVKDHEKELGLLSWGWTVRQSGTMHEQSGGGKGKSSFSDLNVTMKADKALPTLTQFCATGEHIDDGLLVMRKAGGDNPVDFLKIELKEIIIAGVSMSGHGEDAMVSIDLNFAEFKLIYADQTGKGAKGSAPEFAYNIAKVEKK